MIVPDLRFIETDAKIRHEEYDNGQGNNGAIGYRVVLVDQWKPKRMWCLEVEGRYLRDNTKKIGRHRQKLSQISVTFTTVRAIYLMEACTSLWQ